jgi:hypothetical protein
MARESKTSAAEVIRLPEGLVRDPVDQRDGDHGTWRRPIRLAEPISRIRYDTEAG